AGRGYRTRSSHPATAGPVDLSPYRFELWHGAARDWNGWRKKTRPARRSSAPGGPWGVKGQVRSEGSADADQEGTTGLIDLAGHVLVGDVVAGFFVGEVQDIEGELRLGRQRRQRVARRQVELATVFAEVLAVVEPALVVAERTLGRTLHPVVRQADRGDVVLPV